jgi:hypothetical protein
MVPRNNKGLPTGTKAGIAVRKLMFVLSLVYYYGFVLSIDGMLERASQQHLLQLYLKDLA